MANFRNGISAPEDQITWPSITPSIYPVFPLLPTTLSSNSAVSLPAFVNNGYLKPFLSSPLSRPPTFNPYLCPRFTISHHPSLIPLTNSLSPLLNNPVQNGTSSFASNSTSRHTSPTDVADIPLPESPPASPPRSPQDALSVTKRNKDFSIAGILASVRDEDKEEASHDHRSPENVTLTPVSPKPVLTGVKRRGSHRDECEETTPLAKSAKTTPLQENTPLTATPHPVPFNHVLFNIPPAPELTDACATNTSTSTDSGINLSSNSGSSTPSSNPSTLLATSLASQLVSRVGAEHAQIQHYKRLLSQKWNAMTIASPDEDGDTLLHLAIASEKPDLVRRYVGILASQGFKLDLKNHLRQTPLHFAIITNQPAIIRSLISGGSNVNICDRNGDSAVHLACKWGDQNTLRIICESENYKPDLNAKNHTGLAAIHLAAINNKTECIKVLIDNGAEKNIGDGTSGKTALHHAIEGKHYSMITLLVQFDLDVNIPTFSGTTPLQFASGLSEQEIVSYLIHNGTVATRHMPAVLPQDRLSNRSISQQPEPTSSTVRQSPVNLT